MASPRSSRDEGRGLLTSAAHLVRDVMGWVNTVVDVTEEEISACKVRFILPLPPESSIDSVHFQALLRSVLDCVITACAHCLQTSLTQRCFEKYFPRLTIHSSVQLGWEKGHEAVLDVIVGVHRPSLFYSFRRLYRMDTQFLEFPRFQCGLCQPQPP